MRMEASFSFCSRHQLSAYAACTLDVLSLVADKPLEQHCINACGSVVEIIRNMLEGGTPLEEDRPSTALRVAADGRRP